MLDKVISILSVILLCSCASIRQITQFHDNIVEEISIVKFNDRFTLERYKQYYTEFVLFNKLNEYDNLCKKDCRKLNNKMNIFIYDVDFSISSSVYLYDKNDYRLYFMIKLH